MEVFVIVSYIDKCSEQVWWEDDFECFAIFLDGIQEAEAAQTVHLKLMLYFKVLTWIALDVDLRGISIELRTVLHQ